MERRVVENEEEEGAIKYPIQLHVYDVSKGESGR
jgi:hypothetical protein